MNIEITENAKDYLAKKNKNTIVMKYCAEVVEKIGLLEL